MPPTRTPWEADDSDEFDDEFDALPDEDHVLASLFAISCHEASISP